MKTKKAVWILNHIQGFGIQKFKRLREALGDLTGLFDAATLDQLGRAAACGHDFVRQFLEIQSSGSFERESDLCAKDGIDLLSILDSNYPGNLSAIYDPPLILY